MRQIGMVLCAASLAVTAVPAEARAPETWDGLVQVNARRMSLGYLLPGADFRNYSQVIIEPAQFAFATNWQRDFNRSQRGTAGRISDADVRRAVEEGSAALDGIFARRFRENGLEVVTVPGPQALRISLAVINVRVAAPDNSIGRSRVYSFDAGEATFVIEARDSLSNQLLARGIDRRTAGSSVRVTRRTFSSNRADFEALFNDWANASVRKFNELREASPVDVSGMTRR